MFVGLETSGLRDLCWGVAFPLWVAEIRLAWEQLITVRVDGIFSLCRSQSHCLLDIARTYVSREVLSLF
jgi:hypothetical protein